MVKRPDAPSLTVQVTQETSVSIFKQRVADAWGIHVRAFRLYHSKKGIDGEGYRRVLEWSPGIIEQGVEVVLKLSGGAGSKRSAGGSARGAKLAAGDKDELMTELLNNVTQKQAIVQDFRGVPMTQCGAKVTAVLAGFNANPDVYFNTLLTEMPIDCVQKINDTISTTNNNEQKMTIICKQLFRTELAGLSALLLRCVSRCVVEAPCSFFRCSYVSADLSCQTAKVGCNEEQDAQHGEPAA